MLWSRLAQWPQDQPIPAAVRRHMRITRYLTSREGDLTGWRFAKELEAARLERAGRPVEDVREAIAEIDRVLRWMRNTDWPFR